MTEDFDDLDRAIFALPLATPPSGLRQSILRATIYATQNAPVFAMREIVAIGAALGIAALLVLYAIFNPAFGGSVATQLIAASRALADTQNLAWLAGGVLVAYIVGSPQWLSLRRNGRTGPA